MRKPLAGHGSLLLKLRSAANSSPLVQSFACAMSDLESAYRRTRIAGRASLTATLQSRIRASRARWWTAPPTRSAIQAVAHGVILKPMAHAIKVDSPFVTAHDTADTLGVSRSRANTLIERARRIVFRDSKTGEFTTELQRKRKGAGRSPRPNGATKSHQSKSKRAKAKR
jgi:hypothetical protein